MPVYPAAAGSAASCASPGCRCRDRRPCYPSDLTGRQRAVPEPRAREVMAELAIAAGRPMAHDLRAMCDAVSYAAKNGVERRALPVDLPPREAAYAFFERRNGRGLPAELVRRLRELLRQHQGRAAQPTACIVDSQIVKARDTVAGKTSGYQGGKKITGRGRHLAVGKPLGRSAQAVAAVTVEVVARTSPHSFQVLRRRRAVERTFGWLMRYRRLTRDYERTTANSEAMIYWATIIIMTRRLARYENGQPRPRTARGLRSLRLIVVLRAGKLQAVADRVLRVNDLQAWTWTQ